MGTVDARRYLTSADGGQTWAPAGGALASAAGDWILGARSADGASVYGWASGLPDGYCRCVDIPLTGRGGAAAATWTIRGDQRTSQVPGQRERGAVDGRGRPYLLGAGRRKRLGGARQRHVDAGRVAARDGAARARLGRRGASRRLGERVPGLCVDLVLGTA